MPSFGTFGAKIDNKIDTIKQYSAMLPFMFPRAAAYKANIEDSVKNAWEKSKLDGHAKGAWKKIKENPGTVVCVAGGTVAGAMLLPTATVAGLGALGFAKTGIVAHSIAAAWMASFHGAVPAGSLFAFLQSAGTLGTASGLAHAAAYTGGAAGAATGFGAMRKQKKTKSLDNKKDDDAENEEEEETDEQHEEEDEEARFRHEFQKNMREYVDSCHKRSPEACITPSV
ncbi:hypothetical protein EC973_008547 [Apophysomyces ossiformis]|uniref:Uncharacterized protein n=1 Tax=Apophysomyces ossiformis TaxID=679940 RepID=A0A8H7BMU7_9FUNG|nr:hypothetical protein EC973_008547 [Apophysomyces ossiformis]